MSVTREQKIVISTVLEGMAHDNGAWEFFDKEMITSEMHDPPSNLEDILEELSKHGFLNREEPTRQSDGWLYSHRRRFN